MMTKFEIKLEEKFSNKLGIGPTAKKLFQELNGNDSVILNFENIEFMSRSFAQEYVFQKNNSKSTIIEINMNENIERLLELVCEEYEKYDIAR